jgi:diguanylate cyclase (GGDEF)-like protein
MTTQAPIVLAVDDDTMALSLMGEVLAGTCDVVAVSSAEQALEVLRSREVAVVLTDHMLPGMTGVELLDSAHLLRPQAARILITASERVSVFKDAVNRARIHRLLVKPVRWADLPDVIEGARREVQLEVENVRLVAELAAANQRLELEVTERTRELRLAVAKLEELAVRDELTGLFNHRHLQHALDVELSRARRHARPLSVLFIDVDHFKQCNDRYGHLGGDVVLRRIAQMLLGGGESGLPVQTRASDIVGRYGGEEFVLLLPETDVNGARVKAERVRRTIESRAIPIEPGKEPAHVTVSIGLATFPTHASDKAQLLTAADEEVYRAKSEGRNRVCVRGEQ